MAAFGYFFGKEVNRERAENAEQSAANAQTTAQTAEGQKRATGQALSDLVDFIRVKREQRAALATDVDGNPVFLATNKYNLQVTIERWPRVGFHATREHGERLVHA